ncbi:MAG: hypothetical protein KDK44_04045, partial [Chlamydiia bacterium]|nr:hypothetical protein [Chlamydiia bacterium]
MNITCLMNLPNTVMDLANGTYKGRSVPEIIVIIVTVSSAALCTINHYHHNTFHRNYCLVVTLVGIAGCIKIHSYYLLGTQNERMDKNLDRFNDTVDELNYTKEVLTGRVEKLHDTNKALDETNKALGEKL